MSTAHSHLVELMDSVEAPGLPAGVCLCPVTRAAAHSPTHMDSVRLTANSHSGSEMHIIHQKQKVR